MTETLRSLLPAVYRGFLPGFFDTPVPDETKATCSSCAMCAPPGEAPPPDVTYFRPDAKCCTYHPRLPNYLAGAILADERPDMAEGRRRVREKIARRTGTSPQWIAPPRKTEVIFDASRRNAFGRSLVLLCPYFEREGALCTIWRQREIVCSTFFCKYVDGADGERLWKSARALVGWIERVLSLAAAVAIAPGYAPSTEGGLTLEDLEDRPPRDADHAALWGAWAGREEELYLRAHDWVRGLDEARFEAIVASSEYAERLAGARVAHEARISTALPERLQPNPEMSARPAGDGVLVTTYSRYEPMQLSEGLHDVVREFSPGETVDEVRARLYRDAEVELPDELLVALVRFRVLVDAGSTET